MYLSCDRKKWQNNPLFLLRLGMPHSCIYSPWKLTLYHCSWYWTWQIRVTSAEIVSKVQLFKIIFLLNTVQRFSINENSRTKKRLIFLLMPNTSIKWESSGCRAALQRGIWGCWPAGGSVGVSIALTAQRANPSLGYIKHSTPSQS